MAAAGPGEGGLFDPAKKPLVGRIDKIEALTAEPGSEQVRVTLKFASDTSAALHEWIDTGFDNRRAVAPVTLIRDGETVMTLHRSVISELGMPALDAASKDAATVTLTGTANSGGVVFAHSMAKLGDNSVVTFAGDTPRTAINASIWNFHVWTE